MTKLNYCTLNQLEATNLTESSKEMLREYTLLEKVRRSGMLSGMKACAERSRRLAGDSKRNKK